MSNRKETVFAMFATTSIGAIWGGPVPYYGAQVSYITICGITVLFESKNFLNAKWIKYFQFIKNLIVEKYQPLHQMLFIS